MNQLFIETTNKMAEEVHQNAVDHGFYGAVPSIPERLMLIVSELAEALEEYRNDTPTQYVVREELVPGSAIGHRINWITNPMEWRPNEKPEGIASELADAVIRIMDTCAEQGIDIGLMIVKKHEYNKTRSYKHVCLRHHHAIRTSKLPHERGALLEHDPGAGAARRAGVGRTHAEEGA